MVQTEEGKALSLQLELLGKVAHATVKAILHVVDERRSGLLTPEEEEKIDALRVHLETAITAVDDYTAREGDEAIDLGGLRARLVSILEIVRARTTHVDALPS